MLHNISRSLTVPDDYPEYFSGGMRVGDFDHSFSKDAGDIAVGIVKAFTEDNTESDDSVPMKRVEISPPPSPHRDDADWSSVPLTSNELGELENLSIDSLRFNTSVGSFTEDNTETENYPMFEFGNTTDDGLVFLYDRWETMPSSSEEWCALWKRNTQEKAAASILAFYKGKKTREQVSKQLDDHDERKERIYAQAMARVLTRKGKLKEQKDEMDNLKEQVAKLTIQNRTLEQHNIYLDVESNLHQRQIHHLRKQLVN